MKILLSAYACEPDQGSEPGVGWNWARSISASHDVWVLTRANNARSIRRHLESEPIPRLHFIYVDLPRWAGFWKRGQHGVHLYYYLWQFAAYRAAREAHREIGFDAVQHVTFATAFVPATIGLLRVPFVWGPVGGGVRVPWRLVSEGGLGALLYECLRAARRAIGRYLDPCVRLTWRSATVILVQNPDTARRIPRKYWSRVRVVQNGGFDSSEIHPRSEAGHRGVRGVIPARLVHLKGVSLAIRALAVCGVPDLHLVVAGDGPERGSLLELVRRLGVDDRVEFRGWLSRSELFALLAESDILVFPSLHDECGFAVIEGMAHGAAPIVLDIGGPPRLTGNVGVTVRARGMPPGAVVQGLACALRTLADPAQLDKMRPATLTRAARFEWRYQDLSRWLDGAVAQSPLGSRDAAKTRGSA